MKNLPFSEAEHHRDEAAAKSRLGEPSTQVACYTHLTHRGQQAPGLGLAEPCSPPLDVISMSQPPSEGEKAEEKLLSSISETVTSSHVRTRQIVTA